MDTIRKLMQIPFAVASGVIAMLILQPKTSKSDNWLEKAATLNQGGKKNEIPSIKQNRINYSYEH